MSGVGTMQYGNSAKPYQVTLLTPTGAAVPVREQTLTYTSFQRSAGITENGFNVAFTYNAAGDRVKMQVAQGATALLTRYYIGKQYELDAQTNTERLYLGGDVYSAPAVYLKEAGNWKIYYISSINTFVSLPNNLVDTVFPYFRHISILTKGQWTFVKVN